VRRRILVLGIVIALVGLALWYVPLQPDSTGSQLDSGTTYVVGDQAPLSILGAEIPFTLAWETHNITISVSIYACGPQPKCHNVGPSNYLTGDKGTSGTLHWNGKANEYYAVVSSSKPLHVTLSYPEPVLGGTAGLGTLIFGGFVAVLGTFLATPPARSASPEGRTHDADVLGPDPL
jgi:hypothetical protein